MQRRKLAAFVCASLSLAVAAPAAALVVHIGGRDDISQYTHPGAPSESGVFSFDDSRTTAGSPADGMITSSDLTGAGTCANICSGFAELSIVLDPLQDNGVDPFDPATTNLKRARFVGATGANDFVLWDPTRTTVLLSFNVLYIDVATATTAVQPIDPDGSITLGQPDLNSVGQKNGSHLVLTGGTLNAHVGGIGKAAALGLFITSPNPAILSSSDFMGYLGTNFTSGVGPAAPAGTTWDLTVSNPEPSTALLVATGLLGMVAYARRRSPR